MIENCNLPADFWSFFFLRAFPLALRLALGVSLRAGLPASVYGETAGRGAATKRRPRRLAPRGEVRTMALARPSLKGYDRRPPPSRASLFAAPPYWTFPRHSDGHPISRHPSNLPHAFWPRAVAAAAAAEDGTCGNEAPTFSYKNVFVEQRDNGIKFEGMHAARRMVHFNPSFSHGTTPRLHPSP